LAHDCLAQASAEEIAEQKLERREIARLMGAAELTELRKPKPPAA